MTALTRSRFRAQHAAHVLNLALLAAVSAPLAQAQGVGDAVPVQVTSMQLASDAANPSPDVAPTDIGRVSTGPAAEAPGVVPSPTRNRAAAVAEKKQAPNLIEVQPLEEIRKLPDINTAEALQRVPGISLETDSGEGRFISIRGLAPDLNGTSYAGVRLPVTNPASPFNGSSRATAFDTFPTGIIGGIEVTKTGRPDLDAEALGGSINLVPRSGDEHGGKLFFEGDLGGGYEPLRDSPVYNFEGTVGRSFDGGAGIGGLFAGPKAFSALLTAVYHDDQRGIDDIEESYIDAQGDGVPDKALADLQFRRYKYHRKRYGVGADFEAKADEHNRLYARLLWSGYLEGASKHYLVLKKLDSDADCTPLPSCIQDPADPNGFVSSGTQLRQSSTDGSERIQNQLAVLGGSSVFSSFKLDYRVSVAQGSDHVPRSYGGLFVDSGVAVAYDNNTDPRFPTFHTTNDVDPADPANYTLDSISFSQSRDKDREWGGALDATIPVDYFKAPGELKFGLDLRLRKKTHDESSVEYDPNDGAPDIPLTPYVVGGPQIYYGGRYDIGPDLNRYSIRALAADRSLTTPITDPAADASASVDDTENVYAGYGQYTVSFGKAGLLAGLRVERTEATYRGNIFNAVDPPLDSNTPASRDASYTNYFPTVQGRYAFREDLVGRLTYSTAIARPGFQQITTGAQVSVADATVTVGNPNLKPTTGNSFDGTLEFYPGKGQIVSAGLFDKEFSDYILLSQQTVPGYNYPGLTTTTTKVDSFSNGPARAYGAEAQFEQRLLFLPQPLDGLGVSGNITLVHSDAELRPGRHGLLPGTARVTWNAAAFYEKGPVNVRVAADFVSQSLFAFNGDAASGDASTDTFLRRRLTLDLGSSYAFMHGLSFYFNAKNLLNTPLEYTEGKSEARPIQREFYDITLLGGFRASFD